MEDEAPQRAGAPPAAGQEDEELVEIEPLQFDEHIFDIAFHPHRPLIASGLITGTVHLHEYSPEQNRHILHINHHKQSCRALEWSRDGAVLFSGSADKTIAVFDLHAQSLVATPAFGHENPINALKAYNESILVSGDDDGVVKLWDIRAPSHPANTLTFKEHSDFISDICPAEDKRHVLATSGDGHLSVFDIRGRGKLVALSDNMDDELLSIVRIKHGRKVVCGSQEGVLMIFTYGLFGDLSDRFPGHPQSVETMVAIDEDTICTGSSDGMIRMVHILPNAFLGVVGEHSEFPIEVLRRSFDGRFLASCSHDKSVKFWDIGDDDSGGAAASGLADIEEDANIEEGEPGEEDEGKRYQPNGAGDVDMSDGEDASAARARRRGAKQAAKQRGTNRSSFFDGL